MRPRLLDLFCGAGGASMGYYHAGFDVVGVDIAPQPHYPFEFHQADAFDYLTDHGQEFDAIHASPPCQAYTSAQRLRGYTHPDLIARTRQGLASTGLHYVIENVVGSPLIEPAILCGAMFSELRVYRHRLFEVTFPASVPTHPEHTAPLRKMGRPPQPGDFMHVVGNFSGVAQAREAMGINWMTRNELREAIPPAYTHHIGAQLLNAQQVAA